QTQFLQAFSQRVIRPIIMESELPSINARKTSEKECKFCGTTIIAGRNLEDECLSHLQLACLIRDSSQRPLSTLRHIACSGSS
ncbi:MAG: hypothetical protein C4294_08940, partial [Nitrospiraceae bacterium]